MTERLPLRSAHAAKQSLPSGRRGPFRVSAARQERPGNVSGNALAVSDASVRDDGPWFILPGFMPDAVGFAARTTVAVLLAYLVAFAIQLESASSAGLCVAIVAQPTPGMTMSKAVYRVAGTVLGGIVAFALVGLFPQDRTTLLAAFTLWLGACTFVAALLRDFRSYGAVLCGYTVGIIAVSGIDAPNGALLATLDRVAAILLGVVCAALVNALFSRAVAWETLVAARRRRLAAAEALAQSALAGDALPNEPLPAQEGASILSHRTEANHAATELPDGRARNAGARAAIAGLLGMLSAARAIATGLRQPPDPATRRMLDAAAARLRSPGSAAGEQDPGALDPLPTEPQAAALLDRAEALLRQHARVRQGLHALETGDPVAEPVQLPVHYDVVGAGLSAARTVISVGLGCVFCVYAGWPGATLLLVQQAAFTALLGMQPHPSAAGVTMGLSLPVPALAAGIISFVLLPQASGYVPFALALAPFIFAAALAARHPATAQFGPGLLLYLLLLLSPANTEVFDFSAFMNTLLVQMLAVLFMVLSFRLVLPVSRRRRLARVADAIVRQVQRALHGPPDGYSLMAARCLFVDRLAQAQVWLGRPTPARLAVLQRLSAFTELESALRRARAGLHTLGRTMPPPDPRAFEAAARELLAGSHAPGAARQAALQAAAGLHGASVLLRLHGRALRRYGGMEEDADVA